MASLESLLKLLSEPKRLAMWIMLMEEPYCVCDIERFLVMKQANVSKHLQWFRELDLVDVKKDYKWVHYKLSNKTLAKHETLCKYIKESAEYHRITRKLQTFVKDACDPKKSHQNTLHLNVKDVLS